MILESDIETYLINEIKKLNGLCLKWPPNKQKGVPDRIAIIPGYGTVFIELKRKGGKISPIQKFMINKIKKAGGSVRVITGKREVKLFIEAVNYYRRREK
jgi:hypothetical protein